MRLSQKKTFVFFKKSLKKSKKKYLVRSFIIFSCLLFLWLKRGETIISVTILRKYCRYLQVNIFSIFSTFYDNFHFWPKFRLLTKISIFDRNLYFQRKFPFLTEISTFNENFLFWPKFLLSTKISIFDIKIRRKNLDF